jgi:hypothetical protein
MSSSGPLRRQLGHWHDDSRTELSNGKTGAHHYRLNRGHSLPAPQSFTPPASVVCRVGSAHQCFRRAGGVSLPVTWRSKEGHGPVNHLPRQFHLPHDLRRQLLDHFLLRGRQRLPAFRDEIGLLANVDK